MAPCRGSRAKAARDRRLRTAPDRDRCRRARSGPGSRPSRTWPTARVRSHDLGPRHGRRAPFLSFAGGPPIERPIRVFHSPQVRHAHRRYF
jgi:hypothetical protein